MSDRKRTTVRGWHTRAAIYRTLVVAQTIAWAVMSFAGVVRRQHRSVPGPKSTGMMLAVGSIIGLSAGILTYYVRRSQSRDRNAVVVAWVWFQGAGLLALAGYLVSGFAMCLFVGFAALGVMHAFSPNRFQDHFE